MKGALLFAQSGGPTAVINASACGVFQEAKKHPEITDIYAGLYGIDGVLSENIIDINCEDDEQIELLKQTPSSALGSCRHKLPDFKKDEAPYQRLLEVFEKYNVRYFIYNGGNDSMDTCNKVAKYCKLKGYECAVVGVPKTVDNDLACTDHCPGFGSVAKYIATTIHEIALDAHVFKNGRAVIVEIMGRDAGWITASAAIPELLNGLGADLVYVPERPFDMQTFLEDVKTKLNENHTCVVAVSEGIRDKDGKYISEYAGGEGFKDSFNHVQLGDVCFYLAQEVTKHCGTKARAIELSIVQRAAAHIASDTDKKEAWNAGSKAVKYAVSGKTNVMVTFQRTSDDPYKLTYKAANLNKIANAVKHLPDEYINEAGNGINKEFLTYVLPLIKGEPKIKYDNGIPKATVLKKVIVKK